MEKMRSPGFTNVSVMTCMYARDGVVVWCVATRRGVSHIKLKMGVGGLSSE